MTNEASPMSHNDLYGHVAGDATLIKIGDTLRAALLRPTDMVVRYGGEEFIILLCILNSNFKGDHCNIIKLGGSINKAVNIIFYT